MKKIFFLFIITLIIIPIPAIANITTDSVILNTKLATWNATNFSTLESINLADGGIKIKASATGEEKNFTFYRSGSTTPLLVSLISHTVNTTTFTINNSPPSDTMLNITGSSISNLYLNTGIANSNWSYANGINTVSIGAMRTVTIYWTGATILPNPTPSGGGGGGSTGSGSQIPTPLPQTNQMDVLVTGYNFVANLGDTQNGNLQIKWSNPASDITISSITLGDYSTWLAVQQTPITLAYKQSPTAYAIPISLHVPAQGCDILKGITINCAETKSYTIPVTINAIINGQQFTTVTNVSVNVQGSPNNGLVLLGQMIILAIIAFVILGMVFHAKTRKHPKKQTATSSYKKQKSRQKEGTFMKRMKEAKPKVTVTNIQRKQRPKKQKEGTFLKQFK